MGRVCLPKQNTHCKYYGYYGAIIIILVTLVTVINKKESLNCLKLSRKSGDDLLSHKAASERSEDSRFVGAGGDRSHAARTKFVPGGSPNRRHHRERRLATPIYAKRRVLLELVFS